jgi:hypothetical protein
LTAACLGLAPPAPAAETEIREFRIAVDGKPAGEYRLSVTRQDDGTLVQSGQADVRLRVLIKNYSYTYRGTETWKNGRLVKLDSTCNDDGKAFAVSAQAADGKLKVRVNGVERTLPGDAWTTSYWQLPPAAQRNRALSILDADCGDEIAGRLEYAGSQPVSAGGQSQHASKYRVSGGKLKVEVWYDSSDRLIRQESVEDGHKTVFELIRVRKQ